MDGGPLEKQKAEEIKAEVNSRRRRGRRRRQMSRESISADNALSLRTDLDEDRNNGLWNAGAGRAPKTPTAGHANEDSSDIRRDSHLDCVDNATGISSDPRTLPANDIFSASPHDSGFHSDDRSLATFEQVLASGSDFDPPVTTATWEQLVGNDTSFFGTPLPDPGENLTFDFESAPLANTVSPLPELNGLLDPALFVEPVSQHVLASSSSPPYHVFDHILPNVLPSLDQKAQDTLRERSRLVHAGNNSKSMVNTSATALQYCFQKIGLERISGRANIQLDGGIRENVSEALRLIRASFQSPPGDDQALSEMALSLLQILLLHIEQGSSEHESIASLLHSITTRENPPFTIHHVITKVALGFAVAHDVIWSASTRRRATSVTNFLSPSLDLAQSTGCERWVFQSIAEVTSLRIWKRERQASQALNIAELARRATKLEQQIDNQTQQSVSNNDPNPVVTDVDPKPCSAITRAYVAAAKIYLHVILSGASPEVSDIQDAVVAAMDAIKALTSAALIRQLAWPICVAACLAEPQHDTFFDRLEQGARGDKDYCTSVLRALEVAKETKRLRRNSSSRIATFDWIDGMESLGHEWVLL
ncbi:hypothetical protein PRZ48_015273 [Zasmidium cellare]|uniref:Uncharacterized protein n=1 Tax=Zasmidium cellare TaxID=395010 RepID=A0ABR0DWM7_ZASCE|nr:hypothetical protein PRZ48_015273 [Zasmidium cellare]